MMGRFKALFPGLIEAFADRKLPTLILGVVAAAAFFAFVLKADAAIVFGVLAIGCLTAIIESAHHHRKK